MVIRSLGFTGLIGKCCTRCGASTATEPSSLVSAASPAFPEGIVNVRLRFQRAFDSADRDHRAILAHDYQRRRTRQSVTCTRLTDSTATGDDRDQRAIPASLSFAESVRRTDSLQGRRPPCSFRPVCRSSVLLPQAWPRREAGLLTLRNRFSAPGCTALSGELCRLDSKQRP
jgi:hypothetical protein